MIGAEPELTFLIDMDPAKALARGLARGSGEDRFEEMGLGFQQTLRAGFLALAAAAPERFRVIDGDRAPEAIAAEIAEIALPRIGSAP